MGLYVRESLNKGHGVFAALGFAPGDEVLEFRGPALDAAEVPFPLRAEKDHYLQIDVRTYLGPSGWIDDLVNHSCDPNCWVKVEDGRALLLARRPIEPDEEITFDYSTTSTDDPLSWSMFCACKSAKCRVTVSGFGTLPSDAREEYLRESQIPDYVYAATCKDCGFSIREVDTGSEKCGPCLLVVPVGFDQLDDGADPAQLAGDLVGLRTSYHAFDDAPTSGESDRLLHALSGVMADDAHDVDDPHATGD